MKLYRQDRVERIEASVQFLEAKQKADARKQSSRKAVVTKWEKMQDYLDELTIEVPQMEKAVLIKAAQENFYSLGLPDGATPSIERMCVNFLRHCGTKYESELAKIAGKTGAKDAYYCIKQQVLDAIEIQYDWLAEECRRQTEQLTKQQHEQY